MRLTSLGIIVILSSLLSAFLSSGLSFAAPPAQCLAKMPGGKFKGLCLDLTDFRTVTQVSEAERQQLAQTLMTRQGASPAENLMIHDIADSHFEVVGEFAYHGGFYRVVIPMDRIQDVVYEQVVLLPNVYLFHKIKISNPVKVSHSQLRFRLSPEGPPVRLISDDGHVTEIPKGAGSDDLIFALWAVRAQGHEETFNPFHGAEGEYAATYALQNFKDGTEWTIKMGLPMHQYLLKLTPQQSRATLLDALAMGYARGITFMYDTNTNSCSNAVFDVLKKVFFNEKNEDGAEKFLQSADPVTQLELQHMIDKSVKLPDLTAGEEAP